MMQALHFLITYRCSRECPHCFVWGSPRAHGTFERDQLLDYLRSAARAGIESVAFEGGEPFLEYDLLRLGVSGAAELGLPATIVTNGSWAVSPQRASDILLELKGLGMTGLMISSDAFHGGDLESERAAYAFEAAQALGVSSFVAPTGPDSVMYRGRAAHVLAPAIIDAGGGRPVDQAFAECRRENLESPSRVHIDAFGNVMVCQGLAIGNANRQPLDEILTAYEPHGHPVVSVLLAGGPLALGRLAGLGDGPFADECHLCYEARRVLRERYPRVLAPPRLYGECS